MPILSRPITSASFVRLPPWHRSFPDFSSVSIHEFLKHLPALLNVLKDNSDEAKFWKTLGTPAVQVDRVDIGHRVGQYFASIGATALPADNASGEVQGIQDALNHPTPDEIAADRAEKEAGKDAADIADELDGVSMNAVFGDGDAMETENEQEQEQQTPVRSACLSRASDMS